MIETPSRPLGARVQELRDGNAELGMQKRLHEFSSEDLEIVVDLLSALLTYEPSMRPSIEEVLRHPAMSFFTQIC